MKTTAFTSQTLSNVVATVASNSVRVNDGYNQGVGVLLNLTVNAPAAATFTAVSDVITQAAHGYVTGLKVRFTTTDTLPAGLELLTDYYVIALTANTYKVATTLALAVAGTAVDITDTGTGTHTATPVAISATYKVQVSADDVNYVDLAAATAIAASTTVLIEDLNPMYSFIKVLYTMTAGSISVVQNIVVKGE